MQRGHIHRIAEHRCVPSGTGINGCEFGQGDALQLAVLVQGQEAFTGNLPQGVEGQLELDWPCPL